MSVCLAKLFRRVIINIGEVCLRWMLALCAEEFDEFSYEAIFLLMKFEVTGDRSGSPNDACRIDLVFNLDCQIDFRIVNVARSLDSESLVCECLFSCLSSFILSNTPSNLLFGSFYGCRIGLVHRIGSSDVQFVL